MGRASPNSLGKVLAFAAVVEVGTGLALMIDPAIVITLLLGANEAGQVAPLGRVLGIALLALGLACRPSRQRLDDGSQAFQGMLTYNLLIAVYLAYIGTVGHLEGMLLWPGVVLHSVVALLLIWARRRCATDSDR